MQSDTDENIALEHLDRARSRPVAFAARSNFNYDASSDEENNQSTIWTRFVVSFNSREFLHIIEKYNDDWWIGRLVKQGSELGFVPSPIKIENLRIKQLDGFAKGSNISKKDNNNSNFDKIPTNGNHEEQHYGGSGSSNNNNSISSFRPRLVRSLCIQIKDKMDHLPPYDIVPTVRPLILIGPSLKGFQVTDKMQKVIFDFLKYRFVDRIIITRVTADISQEHRATSRSISPSSGITRPILRDRLAKDLGQVSAEIERIFELSHAMQLIALDCDTINHPDQIVASSLAPIVVYLKVSSSKVLKKIIKAHDRTQIGVQMDVGEKLLQLPREAFDVVLDETQLEEACEHLAEYLESYWRALDSTPTRVVD